MTRLTDWEALTDDTDRVICVLGDSTGESDFDGTGPPYPRILRKLMQKRWTLGSYGARGTWVDDWTFTTSGNAWTQSTISDTWDCGVYVGDAFRPFTSAMFASGSAKVATWTKPAWMTEAITSFKLAVIDGASSANFAYRIDGGSWTNVSHTWNQNNSFDIITIASAVTSTVEVRAANAAGTSVSTYLAWLEPVIGTGFVLHDLTAGGQELRGVARTTSGTALAFIDALQPSVTSLCYTNDLNSFDQTAWETQLQAVVTRALPYGAVVPCMFWGQNRVNWAADAPLMQAGIDNIVATNTLVSMDLWARYGDYAETNAAGLMFDDLHPNDYGSLILAVHNFWPLLALGRG